MATKQIIYQIIIRDDGTAVLKRVGTAATQTGKKMNVAAKQASSGWGGVTKQVKLLAASFIGIAAAIMAFRKATEVIMGFQTAMAEVSTLVDTSKVSMEEFRKSILALAPAVGKAPQELASGLYQVVSAGIATADAMGVLTISAKAAIAGLTDTFTAVDIITTGLNAYGFAASEATRVSDILFTTVRLGKTTFNELAGSLGQVLPFTAQLKISLEEVGAAMATLTAAGLSTEIATTALRALAVSFINQAPKWKEAGIDIIKVLGEEGITGAMRKLEEITGGSIQAMYEFIPETRALAAGLNLAGAQAEKFADNMEEMKNATGATEVAYAKMSDTLEHSVNVMWANLRVILNELANSTLPAFNAGVNTLTFILKGMSDILKDLSIYLQAIAAAWLALGIVKWGAIVTIVKNVFIALRLAIVGTGVAIALTIPQVAALALALGFLAIVLDRAARAFGESLARIFEADVFERAISAQIELTKITEDTAQKFADMGFAGANAIQDFHSQVTAGILVMRDMITATGELRGVWVNTAEGAYFDKIKGEWIKISDEINIVTEVSEEFIKKWEDVQEALQLDIDKIGLDKFEIKLLMIELKAKKLVEEFGKIPEAMEKIVEWQSKMTEEVENQIEKEEELRKIKEEGIKTLKEKVDDLTTKYKTHYDTLKSIHAKAVDEMKAKSEEILAIEERIRDTRMQTEDLLLQVKQKTMTETEVYYSSVERLEEKLRMAQELTGGERIKMLKEIQREWTSLTGVIKEGENVTVTAAESQRRALDAIKTIGEAIVEAQKNKITVLEKEIKIWGDIKSKAEEALNSIAEKIRELTGTELSSIKIDISTKEGAMEALNDIITKLKDLDIKHYGLTVEFWGAGSTTLPLTEKIDEIISKIAGLKQSTEGAIGITIDLSTLVSQVQQISTALTDIQTAFTNLSGMSLTIDMTGFATVMEEAVVSVNTLVAPVTQLQTMFANMQQNATQLSAALANMSDLKIKIDLGNVPQQLTSMAQSIAAIVDKNIKIIVESRSAAQQLSTIARLLFSMPEKKEIEIIVEAEDALSVLRTIAIYMNQIVDKNVTVKINFEGEGSTTRPLLEKIREIKEASKDMLSPNQIVTSNFRAITGGGRVSSVPSHPISNSTTSATYKTTYSPVIHINGSNKSPQQIAAEVDKMLAYRARMGRSELGRSMN